LSLKCFFWHVFDNSSNLKAAFLSKPTPHDRIVLSNRPFRTSLPIQFLEPTRRYMADVSVVCGGCKQPIVEESDRQPCSGCGSNVREFSVAIALTLSMHDSLKFKHKRNGELLAEGFSGEDLHRKTGKWMTKNRVLDHENDAYLEVVTDPVTSVEIHHCEEPLSKHTGHGSNRKKRAG